MANQATGEAITIAIITSFTKLPDNNEVLFITEAPSTLRTFAPFLVYKLFENEHYTVRICYFFLLLHFLQHYMNLPV